MEAHWIYKHFDLNLVIEGNAAAACPQRTLFRGKRFVVGQNAACLARKSVLPVSSWQSWSWNDNLKTAKNNFVEFYFKELIGKTVIGAVKGKRTWWVATKFSVFFGQGPGAAWVDMLGKDVVDGLPAVQTLEMKQLIGSILSFLETVWRLKSW